MRISNCSMDVYQKETLQLDFRGEPASSYWMHCAINCSGFQVTLTGFSSEAARLQVFA